MNDVPNFHQFVPQEATIASVSVQPLSQHGPRDKWRRMLRPDTVENLVLAADLILIVGTSLVCSFVYLWISAGDVAKFATFVRVGIIIAANFAVIMAARRNYSLKNLAQFTKQAKDAMVIWSGVYAMLAIVGFTMKISNEFSRGSTILFFFGGLTALLCWRLVVANVISRSLAFGSFAPRKIIIIAERDQKDTSRSLAELRRYGYQPVKTWEVSSDEIASTGAAGSLRVKLAEVIKVARNERIQDIYLLVPWHHDRLIDGILEVLAVLPISIHLAPDEIAARFLSHPIASVGGIWTAELKRAPLTDAELAAKRFFDMVLATAALLTLAPLMLMTALLIKIDSRGPVFFVQKRNGFNGRAFNIFKFRTMHVLEDGPVIEQATRNDPRVTRLGRLLRKSSIDELPQLFNVLRGEMSLVGPRPHAMSHNSKYENLISRYAFRHHVKPGLTGWAQVNGHRGETRTIEQMQRRVDHDLWYIDNWSPLLDLRIVFQTVLVALRQNSAY